MEEKTNQIESGLNDKIIQIIQEMSQMQLYISRAQEEDKKIAKE